MPIQSISIGPATPILQNVVYALPAKASVLTTSVACEVSLDGVAWTAFTSGGTTGAKFVRCTTGNATIVCSNISSGGSSAGGSLPTDVLGKVLISQGAGVTPIFSKNVLLSGNPTPNISIVDEAQPTNQKRFNMNLVSGSLVLRSQSDAGADQAGAVVLDRAGGISTTSMVQGAGLWCLGNNMILLGTGANAVVRMPPRTLATTPSGQAGDIVNFNDSTVNTPGAIIAGGGGFNVLARHNGTNWICVSA